MSTNTVESRTTLLDLEVGVVEDLRSTPESPVKGPEGFCADFQICFPYAGFFVWHVGSDEVVGDANQVVFVRGGEAFRMSSPSACGYGELVVTPDIGVLMDIVHAEGRHLFEHPLFRRRAALAGPAMQAARAWFCRGVASAAPREHLEAEEALLSLVRAALHLDVRRLKRPAAATAGLIRRAKEVLHERLTDRLRLAEIARDVGASPAYLTDLFTRTEGIPLHQYLTRLRIARALIELPHADDITVLALDLGFSSHSHFTYTFRRELGCTPSEFRAQSRRPWRRGGASVHDAQPHVTDVPPAGRPRRLAASGTADGAARMAVGGATPLQARPGHEDGAASPLGPGATRYGA
jgi:AraC-like DNA-binding protein